MGRQAKPIAPKRGHGRMSCRSRSMRAVAMAPPRSILRFSTCSPSCARELTHAARAIRSGHCCHCLQALTSEAKTVPRSCCRDHGRSASPPGFAGPLADQKFGVAAKTRSDVIHVSGDRRPRVSRREGNLDTRRLCAARHVRDSSSSATWGSQGSNSNSRLYHELRGIWSGDPRPGDAYG
jgi:hypothetical protein